MQVVGNLLKGSGRLVVAILIDHVDLDIPFLHRKLGHRRLLVAKSRLQSASAFRLIECEASREHNPVARLNSASMDDLHVLLLGNELNLPL